MNIRMPMFANTHQLSIDDTYLTTKKILKSLPRQSNPADQLIYQEAYENLQNLSSPDLTGLYYIEARNKIIVALNKKLQEIPLEEKFEKQIEKIENGLLLLEQCSPYQRHCLITHEIIPSNNNTPQFVFIHHLGISQAGIFKLMHTMKKHDDTGEGLLDALREAAHPELKNTINNITLRDIVRLRLHIEEINFFPPTFKGMILGFIAGGLTSVIILNILSLSLPALLILTIGSTMIGASTGLIIEKSLAKKALRDRIGPVPHFSLAPSLYQLLSDEKEERHFWHTLFHWHTPPKATSAIPSPHSSPSPSKD